MADEYIKVGSTFTVTLDTTPLTNLEDFSGWLVHYRRPDGTRGTLTPSTHTGSTMVAIVTPTINPLSVSTSTKWRDGYPGAWEFYPYVQGSGSIEYHGKEGIVNVHSQFRNPS